MLNTYLFSISLEITNTSDQDIYFIDCNAAVNNFMAPRARFDKENDTISAGQTLKAEISITYNDLHPYGIDSIAVIDLAFCIQNGNQYDSRVFTGDVTFKTTLYDSYDASADPYPEAIQNTELQNQYDRTTIYYGEAANYSNENYSLISQAVYSDTDTSRLLLEFSNTSESMIEINSSAAEINGQTVPVWLSEDLSRGTYAYLLPGCRGLLDYPVSRESLEDNGIDTISQYSLTVSPEFVYAIFVPSDLKLDPVNITVILDNN